MALVSLNQLLSAPVVTRAMSLIKQPQSRLTEFFGMRPGGPNVAQPGGHVAGYDIMDYVRSLAKGRAPGTGPATSAPQKIGHVPITIYRSHEKMFLSAERITRIRPLGRNWGEVDDRGQRYVTAQEQRLAQKFTNAREFMISRMMRGSFDLYMDGDDMKPTDTGNGHVTIDYKIPASNKSKLNMLGAGDIISASWSNAATDVVSQFMAINAANEQLHGQTVKHCWLNSKTLGYLLANTQLKNLGGTANTVVQNWTQGSYSGPDGVPDTGMDVVFRGYPFITFHAYDAGLNVTGADGAEVFTKFLPDNYAYFCPEPSSTWCEMYEGSEIVIETVAEMAGSERFGFHAWTEPKTQPAGWELIAVDNCIPVQYIPTASQWALVVF